MSCIFSSRSRELDAARSHPALVRLDAMARTTTYPGWRSDFRMAEGAIFVSPARPSRDFKMYYHRLVEKQRVHEGDRSHPRVVALDALTLTYPGWETEVVEAMDAHFDGMQTNFSRWLDNMLDQQNRFESLGGRSSDSRQNYTENRATFQEEGEDHPDKADVASDTCVICLENPRSHAFVPCGHLCSCETCASESMRRGENQCPLCRQRSEKAIRIFS